MVYNYEAIQAVKLATDARTVLVSSFPSYSPNYTID
jgi:hypothetical protein